LFGFGVGEFGWEEGDLPRKDDEKQGQEGKGLVLWARKQQEQIKVTKTGITTIRQNRNKNKNQTRKRVATSRQCSILAATKGRPWNLEQQGERRTRVKVIGPAQMLMKSTISTRKTINTWQITSKKQEDEGARTRASSIIGDITKTSRL
jgi:hypothetical protein